MKRIIKSVSIIFAILLVSSIYGQSKTIAEDFCITNNESELYRRINEFRMENGKSTIDNSVSLSYVARLHVIDLLNNHPDTSICNLSSWSDKGNWNACCFNTYVKNPDCMWDKPKEITDFTYRGYELALYFEEGFTVDSVMHLIQSTKEARDMVLTNGNYEKKRWICGGFGINENYVSIWFAQRADKAGSPVICSDQEVIAIENNPQTTSFYLIVASFENTKDAREALKRLKQNGYKDSGILRTDTNVRLYINKFDGLKEAMHFKQNLPYTYNDAWIFKQ